LVHRQATYGQKGPGSFVKIDQYMSMIEQPSFFLHMDDESFMRLSSYVTREYGIKLPPSKRSMLESRLNKKVKSLGMKSYKDFLDYIFSDAGRQTDLIHVVDTITTNKTDFYREPAHFKFLSNQFLEQWKGDTARPFNVWSAGCSTGEEPYTILMVLEEFKKRHPHFKYNLLASDVSTRVIQEAYNGIYNLEKIAPVPEETKRTYFLRSKTSDQVRVKPQFRKNIAYKRINLMSDSFGVTKNHFQAIFCRNVLIYFSREVQEAVIRKFASHLCPGGLLFIGHSESIMGMDVPFKQVQPTIYQNVG
jgi:chemotaxis protein methyltransferase CheR